MRLGKLFGIGIELHSTFVWLAVIVIVLLAVTQPQNFLPIIVMLFFLFFTVFLHELVHSVVAAEKGCKVEKIILLPIGGVSVTEELPEKPRDEFLIAIAGPLFNFFVVAAIVVLAGFVQLPLPANWPGLFFSGSLEFEKALLSYPLFGLLYINLLLGAFNLFLPALPLDGGRVARAILASIIGFTKATQLITKISTFIAIFLFLLGFFSGNIIVAVIAIFIYFGAKQEQDHAVLKAALHGEKISSTLNKKPVVVGEGETLARVFALMQKKRQLAFLVKLKGNEFGVIDINKLADVEKGSWKKTTAGEACKKVRAVSASSKASSIITKLLSKNLAMLPVTRRGKLVGVIETRELQKKYELNKLLQGK